MKVRCPAALRSICLPCRGYAGNIAIEATGNSLVYQFHAQGIPLP
jgi:hypothetical protein